MNIPFRPVPIIFGDEYDGAKLRRLADSFVQLSQRVAALGQASSGGGVPSGGTVGQVLTRIGTGFGWASIPPVAYSSLSGVPVSFAPSQHLIASATGLGPAHTISAPGPGSVLVATGTTTARMQPLLYSQLGDVDTSAISTGRIPQWNGAKWVMVDPNGGYSGLTVGTVLTATSPTTAVFQPITPASITGVLTPAQLGADPAQYGLGAPLAPLRPQHGSPYAQLNEPPSDDSLLAGSGRWVAIRDIGISWSQISDVPQQLPPLLGKATKFLRDDGTWATPPTSGGSGSGTVTQVNTGTGLTGGPIMITGTVSLAAIPDKSFLGNTSGSSAAPTPQATGYSVTDTPHLTGAGNKLTGKVLLGKNSATNAEGALYTTGKWVSVQDFDIGWEQLSNVPAQLPPVPGLKNPTLPLTALITNRPFLRGDNVWAKLTPADLGNDNAQFGIEPRHMAPNAPPSGVANYARNWRQLNEPRYSDSILAGDGRWHDVSDISISWTQLADIPPLSSIFPFTPVTWSAPHIFSGAGTRITLADSSDNSASIAIRAAVSATAGTGIEWFNNTGATAYGWVGLGTWAVAGAAITDVGLVSNAGNVYLGWGGSGTKALGVAQHGNVTVFAPTVGVGLTVNGLANSAAVQINGSSTSGQSIGALIEAGTTSADYALYVLDQTGTHIFLKCLGDGSFDLGYNGTGSTITGTAAGKVAITGPNANATLQLQNLTGTDGRTILRFVNPANTQTWDMGIDTGGGTTLSWSLRNITVAGTPITVSGVTNAVTIAAPVSGSSALTVNGVSGTVPIVVAPAGTADHSITLRSPASGRATLDFSINGTDKAFLGVNNAAGDLITGSALNDLILRAQATNIDFSTDSGSHIAMQLLASNAGVVINAPSSATFALSLPAGTATVYPELINSGVLLTTAVTGAHEFDGAAKYFTPFATNRGVMMTEHLQCISAAYTLTSQTAAQKLLNATATGAITLPIGVYEFECEFSLTAMSSTAGAFGFAFGGTATITQAWWAAADKPTTGLSTAAATAFTSYNTAANVAISPSNTNTTGWATVTGILRVTAAGTVIPEVSLGVAAAAVVGANSFFRIRTLGPSGTTTVGQWT